MSEYYHPSSGKTIKIELSTMPGGVSTVTETRNGNQVQTLTMKPDEAVHFVERLVENGWLERKLL